MKSSWSGVPTIHFFDLNGITREIVFEQILNSGMSPNQNSGYRDCLNILFPDWL